MVSIPPEWIAAPSLFLSFACAWSATAAEPEVLNSSGSAGRDGGISPHARLTLAGGHSTADDPSTLSSGGHDPTRNGFNLQGLELGASLRARDHLEGFASYNLFLDSSDQPDGEWEEAFLKIVGLSTGLELRGGFYLNRFGIQNGLHLHDWKSVDSNLPISRFLGDKGLQSIGGELAWRLPWSDESLFTFSAGGVPSQDHGHGHGTKEEEDDEFESHHFEAEDAGFSEHIFAADFRTTHVWNRRHRTSPTLSAAWGENGFGRRTQVYGGGLEHRYTPSGLGGPETTLRTEALFRRFKAQADGISGAEFDEFGIYALVSQNASDRFDVYLRGDFVSGVPDAELERRWRISPGATLFLDSRRTTHLRIQFNYDRLGENAEEHSIWMQMGIALDARDGGHGHQH